MQLHTFIHDVLTLARQGFDTVNSIQGIVIAIIVAMMMRRYGQVLGWSIMATLIHEAVSIGRAMIMHAAHPLPNFADAYVWKLIAIRFVGYFVMITIFFMLRRIFIR